MNGCLLGGAIYIVLAVIAEVVAQFRRKESSSTSNAPLAPASAQPIPPLSIRVRKRVRTVEGRAFPTFSVEMKGQMPGPIYGPARMEFFLHLFDTQKHEGVPPIVLSSLEAFQEEKTPAFQFRTGPLEVSGSDYYPDWVEIIQVPIFCLGFPRKGRRKLKMRFCSILADRIDGRAVFHLGYPSSLALDEKIFYGVTETTFTHQVLESGWLDQSRDRPKVWASAIKLALHMAAVDGSLDKTEGEAVKEWVKKNISMVSEGRAEETKRELNKAIENSYAKASEGRTSLNSICGTLSEIATDRQKYDALNLCVSVMSADGKAEDSEIEGLDRIVTLLGLDPRQYKKMLDPHLAKMALSPVDSAGGNKKALLGIRDGMGEGEIRKILTEEMSKWNALTTSPEPALRTRAEEMLQLIGELRMELLG